MTPQERIKADAEGYVAKTRGQQGRVETYIAGATAEHDRAQVLVDALEKAVVKMKECEEVYNVPCGFVIELCEKTLEQWGGKEAKVYRPCPHCGKELFRDRNLCCRACGKEVGDE